MSFRVLRKKSVTIIRNAHFVRCFYQSSQIMSPVSKMQMKSTIHQIAAPTKSIMIPSTIPTVLCLSALLKIRTIPQKISSTGRARISFAISGKFLPSFVAIFQYLLYISVNHAIFNLFVFFNFRTKNFDDKLKRTRKALRFRNNISLFPYTYIIHQIIDILQKITNFVNFLSVKSFHQSHRIHVE